MSHTVPRTVAELKRPRVRKDPLPLPHRRRTGLTGFVCWSEAVVRFGFFFAFAFALALAFSAVVHGRPKSPPASVSSVTPGWPACAGLRAGARCAIAEIPS